MPNFSKSLKTRRFAGAIIPKSSSKAVRGTCCGVYFFWRGRWFFTCIDGFYLPANGFDKMSHRGHEIVNFKESSK